MIQSHRSPRLTVLPPPTDVPQDVAVRHILETELSPLPDPHTHTRDDVNQRRENDGRRKTTTTANDERRFVNDDDDETEHMFLPTQAAIASTPGRRAMADNVPIARSDPFSQIDQLRASGSARNGVR